MRKGANIKGYSVMGLHRFVVRACVGSAVEGADRPLFWTGHDWSGSSAMRAEYATEFSAMESLNLYRFAHGHLPKFHGEDVGVPAIIRW
jgi:hypothetical protein